MAIIIPEITKVQVMDLNSDGRNPNTMTPREFNSLKSSIRKYGFIIPIITNKHLLIADGEHRWKAAVELGMNEVPTIKLDVEEVDRKIIRQVMNKLRGKHNPTLDKKEFTDILDKGGEDDLLDLLAMDKFDLDKLMADKSLSDVIPKITPEYLEEYNYALIFFRNKLDWEVFKNNYKLPKVRTNEPTSKFKKTRSGIGRVIEGSDFIKKFINEN